MQYVTRYIGPTLLLRPIPREGRLHSGVDMRSPFRGDRLSCTPLLRAIGDRGERRRVTLFSLKPSRAESCAGVCL